MANTIPTVPSDFKKQDRAYGMIRFRYSLRLFFVGFTAVAIVLCWLGNIAREHVREQSAVADARGQGWSFGMAWRGPNLLEPVFNYLGHRIFDRVDSAFAPRIPQSAEASIGVLNNFSSLRVLHLSKTDLSDSGLARLNDNGQIKIFLLSQSLVSDDALREFARFRSLEKLDLENQPIQGHDFALLKSPLRSLMLGDTKVDDEGLKAISQLKTLESLQISSANITDAGIVHLRDLTQLRFLYVGDSQMTDASLLVLAELPQLASLHLSNNPKLTKSALDLSRNKGLESCNLFGLRISDL